MLFLNVRKVMYKFNNEQREITFDKYNTPTPWREQERVPRQNLRN